MTTATLTNAASFSFAAAPHTSRRSTLRVDLPTLLPAAGTVIGLLAAALVAGAQAWMFVAY